MQNPVTVAATIVLFFQTVESSILSENSTHVMQEVSSVIMRLMADESHRFVRPNAGGRPTTVQVDMQIVYIGDFQEADMVGKAFSLELYFRQYWQDNRLAYMRPNIQITLPGNTADKLWQPDTFFENGKEGELHKLTTLNKVMTIHPDGRVFVSTRITLTCLCAMDFRKFPMDRQVCYLNFFSYSFTADDIVFKWKKENKTWSPNLEIAQFTLDSVTVQQKGKTYVTGNYSVLGVKFVFTRRIGHYLTRVYTPAIFIVLMSWLSFFVDRTSAPARVSLGITTILTMTTLLIGIGQGSLPVVSYVKAVDWYLIVCYTLVFGAFAEYVLVNSKGPSAKIEPTTCSHQLNSGKRADLTSSGFLDTSRSQDDSYSSGRAELKSSICYMPYVKTVLKKSLKYNSLDESVKIVFLATFVAFNLLYWFYFLHFDS